jgi:S1-C subfamily serine protease
MVGESLSARLKQSGNRIGFASSAPANPPYASPPVLENRAVDRSNPNFIAEAAEKVGPAVVRIDASSKVANQVPEAFKNPLFRRFFGENLPQPEERVKRGTGSGFILTPDGRIVTNAHVVSGTDTVKVTLKDGREFEGKVQGVDPLTDVAVVKINAKELPQVALGDRTILYRDSGRSRSAIL